MRGKCGKPRVGCSLPRGSFSLELGIRGMGALRLTALGEVSLVELSMCGEI